jgi:alkanesulfonate monooxygenase SsuD/methylene tetrahydromethanopterin reductase-like flavin-dependent oxidoreductase (luciferase family)
MNAMAGLSDPESPVRIGLRPPRQLFDAGAPPDLRDVVERAESNGIDQLCVGDHVTFQGGQGFDGLVQATALAALSRTIGVCTAVYLLPLRHPLPVARQIASLAQLAPGRFTFGVGVGGDDRHEVEACGVDPATRGRRTDESLDLIRRLFARETVSSTSGFFPVDDVRILPVPDPPVPVIVGGRSTAALRRAALLSEGWLALWVTPARFRDGVAEVEATAADAGRTAVPWQHALQVWVGFGSSPEEATPALAGEMEGLYRLPFEKFDRYSPRGTPEDVASALAPFVAAGCRTFNLIPAGDDMFAVVDAAAEVRRLLNA